MSFCGQNISGDNMFYCFDDDIVAIDCKDISDKTLTAGFVNFQELERVYKQLGFSLKCVERCKEKGSFFSSDIEVFDDYSFVKIIVADANDMSTEDCIGLFIRKNLFLVVSVDDEDNSNQSYFMKLLSHCSCESLTIEKLVCAFLEGLISGDNKALENAEYKISSLEETVLKNEADSNFNIKLLEMKNELLTLRGFYEQLIDVGEALRENENELFDESSLKAFRIFTDKAVRLKENVDLLRDSVVHLWDSYQAYLDMKLNQTMKIFTLVTTIFFPLTVIVGWYGMNFKYMPELNARWGYPFVIVLSVAVVVSFILWFKKKKWL
ncbi:MAG: CorA family divalent cation transporter [Eubacteriales bacterium]|nr:CorA family divalent cation transporter [Eubacteriales bacterium]